MPNDKNNNSVLVNKDKAYKKATKMKDSTFSIFFKYFEKVGFQNDLLLDDNPNSILSKLYKKRGGDPKLLKNLRTEYKKYLASEEKNKSMENIIKSIGDDIHDFYNDLLTISPLIQAGFSLFDQQRTSYLQDKEKKKPLNHFLGLSMNGLLCYKLLNANQKLDESLLYFRFQEFPLQIYWLMYSIASGAIHTAIRELRFILESWTRACHVDQKFPGLSLLDKREKQIGLKFNNRYKKKRIIEEGSVNSFPDSIKKISADLWTELNKFSHPDPKELERIDRLNQENIQDFLFNYDKTDQDSVFELLSNLMIIFLELSGFELLLKEPNLDWNFKMIQGFEDLPVFNKLSKYLDYKKENEKNTK